MPRRLEWKIGAIRRTSLPGTDLNKEADRAIAENILEADLGEHADVQRVYNLDQETRDRLLVHAREDAAIVLRYTSSLVDEVRALRKDLRELERGVSLVLVIGLVVYGLKSGDLINWWHSVVSFYWR
jgi:hypothetical protein